MRTLSCILLCFCFVNAPLFAQNNVLEIPKTVTAPTIDGLLELDEWKDATTLVLQHEKDWQVTIYYMRTNEHLYVAFKNLATPKRFNIFPEIIINTNPKKQSQWNKQVFWFHASYSNCEGIGIYNIWENCKTNHTDWQANTFPFQNENDNIEFKISLKKLHIQHSSNTPIGIAFKLGDGQNKNTYWPNKANIADSNTWAKMIFSEK